MRQKTVAASPPPALELAAAGSLALALSLTAVLALAVAPTPAGAADLGGFELTVLVDGRPRPEHWHDGTLYVEALRGREYALRLFNPRPRRVAVALAVDGLNTIDARHTSAREAAKWVIEPYGTIEIAGWQVDRATARRFVFTGERGSYGAWLGETADLGVIEAVFFEERRPPARPVVPRRQRLEGDASGAERRGAPAPRSESSRAPAAAEPAPQAGLADEYAATGMGDGTAHEVTTVDLELERHPAASLRLRYEFRPQLVELGVLSGWPSPLDRRQRARGFESWCPQPR